MRLARIEQSLASSNRTINQPVIHVGPRMTAVDYLRIYRESAVDYDDLVTAEDRDGNLLTALRTICDLRDARVIDVGAGTGRLTRLLAPLAKHVYGFDRAAPMLDVAIARLPAEHRCRVSFGVADARALPARRRCADVVVAGWVFGHLTVWSERTWRVQIARALNEMERVVRPGGALVVLETMGTGHVEPAPPTPALARYYAWLQSERAFSYMPVRTDYEFATLADAVRLTRFFFGEQFGVAVEQSGSRQVPECTGLWWKLVPDDDRPN